MAPTKKSLPLKLDNYNVIVKYILESSSMGSLGYSKMELDLDCTQTVKPPAKKKNLGETSADVPPAPQSQKVTIKIDLIKSETDSLIQSLQEACDSIPKPSQ